MPSPHRIKYVHLLYRISTFGICMENKGLALMHKELYKMIFIVALFIIENICQKQKSELRYTNPVVVGTPQHSHSV